jgi:hypothetical protein
MHCNVCAELLDHCVLFHTSTNWLFIGLLVLQYSKCFQYCDCLGIITVQFDHPHAAMVVGVDDAFLFQDLHVSIHLTISAVDPSYKVHDVGLLHF